MSHRAHRPLLGESVRTLIDSDGVHRKPFNTWHALMSRFSWIRCPGCGWTGRRSELDTDTAKMTCPNCDAALNTE